MKQETRARLLSSIEAARARMRELKRAHESEIEPLSATIDALQSELEEATRKRMDMITK